MPNLFCTEKFEPILYLPETNGGQTAMARRGIGEDHGNFSDKTHLIKNEEVKKAWKLLSKRHLLPVYHQ